MVKIYGLTRYDNLLSIVNRIIGDVSIEVVFCCEFEFA